MRSRSAAADPAAERGDDDTLASRLGDAIASLPSGVLIGLLGLGSLALLMTGRSAWFARTTDRLRLQRSALRADVGVLQSALVPDVPPTIGAVAIGVAFSPAAGPAAGGDFHDVFELDRDRVGVVLGDVSGHGPDALPATAIVRYTIRAYLEAGLEPRAALRLADRALSSSLGDDFATAVVAIHDSRAGTLTYACAGHPAPLILGGPERGSTAVLSAPPIGLGGATGSRGTQVSVGADSRIWFFTDGLTEAHEADGPQLGRDGLASHLADPELEPEGLLGRVVPRGGADDDMTALRLRPTASTTAGEALRIETLEVGPEVDRDALAEFLGDCGVKPQRAERVVSRLRAASGGGVVRVTIRPSRVVCDVRELDPARDDRDREAVRASASSTSGAAGAGRARAAQPAP